MLKNLKNVLVLAPHTDDGEIGAGGLIKNLTDSGVYVYYLAFSTCEDSIPKKLPRDILAKEVVKATKHLGIQKQNLIIKDYKVRVFSENRQSILETMLDAKKKINPCMVLTPSTFDHHQDHEVITQESIRAFKNTNLIGYETPWNNFNFNANLIVKLNENQLSAKMRAYEEYKSQAFRGFNSNDIKTLACSRGLLIKAKYAEAFNIIRQVW